MTAPNAAPEAAQATPEQPMPTPAAMSPQPAAEPDTKPSPTPKKSLEDSLAALDDDTRTYVLAELAKARKEAGDARGAAKAKAAEDAKAEMAQTIGKALGLVQDDEKADPVKLTEQLTAKDAEARQAKVELAVYRAAGGMEANPSALLDSVAFVRSLADVDPSDGDAVKAAITAALDANPTLKTAPTRRLPGPNPAVGSTAAGEPGIDDQIAAAKKAGDVKRWLSLENQKLAAPSR